MKRWALALFVALSLSWVACVRTDGFHPTLIEGPLFTEAAPLPSSDVEAILSQPFHYLSKGRQSFVFESADGKYVLKFFNQKYLQNPWYTFLVEKKEKAKRALRRHYYENSYKIAFQELGDEILYLHLGPSGPLPKVNITDKANREFTLDLAQLPFVLQKRGIPFYSALDDIYAKEGIEGLKREIDSFLFAISLRISKGIADGDHDVEHNWGYVDGHIFHLDPGRLYYDEHLIENSRLKQEWYRATHNFAKWLRIYYPEAANYLAKREPACYKNQSQELLLLNGPLD